MSCKVLAVDYGGTLTDPHTLVDRTLRQRPVDPRAADALWELHGLGFLLVLSSNNREDQDREEALHDAGVLGLFHALVTSAEEGVGKPCEEFYRRVITRSGHPADRLLSAGNNILHDVVAPLQHGFGGAVVIRRGGILHAGEVLPAGAAVLGHIDEIPDLLRRSPWPLAKRSA